MNPVPSCWLSCGWVGRLVMAGGPMAMPEKRWYSVKSLCRWYFKETGESICVEERVVLFLASSFEDTLHMAEQELQEYCGLDDPSANFRMEPMAWFEAFLVDEKPVERIEVFSRLMDTTLSADSFIRRYYPKSQTHKP